MTQLNGAAGPLIAAEPIQQNDDIDAPAHKMDRRSGTIRTCPVRWQAPTARMLIQSFVPKKKKGSSLSSSPLHHAQRQRAQTSKRLHHHRPGLIGLPVDCSNESRWLRGPLKLMKGYPPHQSAHLMSGAVARSVGFGCAQRQLLLTCQSHRGKRMLC